jgi:hypothetical protein
MVVLRAEDWERLRAFAEDEEDVREATAIMARIEAGEGTVPGEVVKLMIADGLSPLARGGGTAGSARRRWRRRRGSARCGSAASRQAADTDRARRGGGWRRRWARRFGLWRRRGNRYPTFSFTICLSYSPTLWHYHLSEPFQKLVRLSRFQGLG